MKGKTMIFLNLLNPLELLNTPNAEMITISDIAAITRLLEFLIIIAPLVFSLVVY
ncbi:MAG: hypothetical protein HQ568_05395 [Calditrichaeota bacterium]|nr:hypothetical protein [Calditrichota bacterium]